MDSATISALAALAGATWCLVRLIAESYLSPNKSLQELHRMVDGDSIDALRDCSEECRAELQKFRLIKPGVTPVLSIPNGLRIPASR